MSQPASILITLLGNEVAPRFDLATEVLMVAVDESGGVLDEKTVVLPHPSAEDLCHLILVESVSVLICGGIEDEFFQYLNWKKIKIIDSVIGPWQAVFERFQSGRLQAGMIIYDERKASGQ